MLVWKKGSSVVPGFDKESTTRSSDNVGDASQTTLGSYRGPGVSQEILLDGVKIL